MPYVVTTKRLDSSTGWADSGLRASRRTVATLEEARDHVRGVVYEACGDYELAPFIEEADSLPESGGTVGPLPDGTVIEVERVEWAELADRADCFPVPWSHEKIIAAYNAREANANA